MTSREAIASKKLKKHQFSRLIKTSIQKKALEYLIKKQGSKGQEIKYETLEMAEDLLPSYEQLIITDKHKKISIRNRMVKIPSNFSKIKEKCPCGQIENMEHIYTCKYWNSENEHEKIPFEKIFEDNILKQIEVSKTFFQNFEKRERFKNEKETENSPHVIHNSDPLSSIFEYGNGL